MLLAFLGGFPPPCGGVGDYALMGFAHVPVEQAVDAFARTENEVVVESLVASEPGVDDVVVNGVQVVGAEQGHAVGQALRHNPHVGGDFARIRGTF
ncbi:MAG: hypothetical protein OXD01_00470 [Gammaproteobacteria bacterium]|nr:hypothetical protein [Gammaproteobacteria bacterium]